MKKKIVSLMLTGVLLAGMPMTVSATTTDVGPTTDGKVPSTNSSNVESDAGIAYVQKTVYQVTLPTGKAFEFQIDPQGLLGSDENPTDGLIIAAENKGAFVKNLSSVPIKVTVDAYVSKDSGIGAFSESSVNLLTLEQADSVNSGIDNNMLVAFDITHDDATIAAVADIKTENVNQQVIAITKNGKSAQTEVGTVITFALDKANYDYDQSAKTYTLSATTPGGDAVGMRVSGFVNTNADWSAYGDETAAAADTNLEAIYVKATYKFGALNVDYDAAALDGRAHGTLDDVTPQYYAGANESGVPVQVAAADAMEYVIGTEPLTIDFDFGSGKDEVTIKKIEADAVTTNTFVPITNDNTKTNYKVYNNQIVFKSTASDVTNNVFDVTNATTAGKVVNIKITTSNDAVTTIPVKVMKAE